MRSVGPHLCEVYWQPAPRCNCLSRSPPQLPPSTQHLTHLLTAPRVGFLPPAPPLPVGRPFGSHAPAGVRHRPRATGDGGRTRRRSTPEQLGTFQTGARSQAGFTRGAGAGLSRSITTRGTCRVHRREDQSALGGAARRGQSEAARARAPSPSRLPGGGVRREEIGLLHILERSASLLLRKTPLNGNRQKGLSRSFHHLKTSSRWREIRMGWKWLSSLLAERKSVTGQLGLSGPESSCSVCRGSSDHSCLTNRPRFCPEYQRAHGHSSDQLDTGPRG
ncbi:uncharacterized protein LOC142871534 [Microcebus murinus]|uniref:uncharacterized protein LOC142871534 n=1 Tax=Microcebus murinus TaxID=30608 RepID=UPI003F6ABD4C